MLIYTILIVGFGLALLATIIEALLGHRSAAWLFLYALLGVVGATIGAFIGFGDTRFVIEHAYLNTLSLSMTVSALLVLCGLAIHNRSGRPDAHRKWKKILLTYVLFAILIILTAMFFHAPTSGVSGIKNSIEQANYCQTDTDCVQLQGQCPFGCYVYVNQAEAGRIKELIDSYDSSCVYGCTEAPAFGCVENKCLPDLSSERRIE